MRYAGAVDSNEINKSYENAIRRITDIAIKFDRYKDTEEAQVLCANVERELLREKVNRLLAKDNINTITAEDMEPFDGCYKSIKHLYITKDPVRGVSKLKTNDSVLPDDLFVNVYDNISNSTTASEDINIDGITTSTPYIRQIKTTSREREYTASITVSLPASINTDTIVNWVEFDVFPFSTAKVINVEYSPVYDDRYLTPIEDLKHHVGCTVNKYSLNGSGHGHIALGFKSVDAKRISITLTQSIPSTDTNDERIFHVGISNLQVKNMVSKNEPMVVDCTYQPSDRNGVYIESINVIHSGIMKTPYTVAVYKRVGSSLVKLHSTFKPFKTGHEPIVFRLRYDRSNNPIILKEIKLSLK